MKRVSEVLLALFAPLLFLVCACENSSSSELDAAVNNSKSAVAALGQVTALSSAHVSKGGQVKLESLVDLGGITTTLKAGDDVTGLVEQNVVSAVQEKLAIEKQLEDFSVVVKEITEEGMTLTVTATAPDTDCAVILSIMIPYETENEGGDTDVKTVKLPVKQVNVGNGISVVNEDSVGKFEYLETPTGEELNGKLFRSEDEFFYRCNDEGIYEYYRSYYEFKSATEIELYFYESIGGTLIDMGTFIYENGKPTGTVVAQRGNINWEVSFKDEAEFRVVNGCVYLVGTESRWGRHKGSGLYEAVFYKDNQKFVEDDGTPVAASTFLAHNDGTLNPILVNEEGTIILVIQPGDAATDEEDSVIFISGTWINNNGVILMSLFSLDNFKHPVDFNLRSIYDGTAVFQCSKFTRIAELPGKTKLTFQEWVDSF